MEYRPTPAIYEQIVHELCCLIACGKYKCDEKLPSIRDMTVSFDVSPNTMQRAYRQLAKLSVIEKKRGMGFFVTKNETLISSLVQGVLSQKAVLFVREAKEMGFTLEELRFAFETSIKQVYSLSAECLPPGE